MTVHSHSAGEILDLSHLPRNAFGHRTPIWWGNVLLVCIELTAFGLMFATTLYVRENFDHWPTDPQPPLLWSTLSAGAGLASLATMLVVRKHAVESRLRAT